MPSQPARSRGRWPPKKITADDKTSPPAESFCGNRLLPKCAGLQRHIQPNRGALVMRIVPHLGVFFPPDQTGGAPYVQFQVVTLSIAVPWGFQPFLSALCVLPWVSRIHSVSIISSDLCRGSLQTEPVLFQQICIFRNRRCRAYHWHVRRSF